MAVRGDTRATERLAELMPTLRPVRVDSERDEVAYSFEELVDLVTCPVCRGLMQDPYYIEECEHVFCKLCIKEHLDGKQCPGSLKEPGCSVQLGPKTVDNCKRCNPLADVVDAILAAEQSTGLVRSPSRPVGSQGRQSGGAGALAGGAPR